NRARSGRNLSQHRSSIRVAKPRHAPSTKNEPVTGLVTGPMTRRREYSIGGAGASRGERRSIAGLTSRPHLRPWAQPVQTPKSQFNPLPGERPSRHRPPVAPGGHAHVWPKAARTVALVSNPRRERYF